MSTGDVLYMVSDDLKAPLHWDTDTLRMMPDPRKVPIVLHTDDGTPWKKLTHPIVSRRWYEDRGYFLYPHYQSMFGETELADQAQELGAIIDAKHLLFEHVHPAVNKRAADGVDATHSGGERFASGQRLYVWRKAHGLTPPLSKPPQSTQDYVAYMQVNKDDFCLKHSVTALRRQGVRNFFFHLPLRSWSGRLTQQNDINAIEAVAQHLRSCQCKIWVEPILLHATAADRRVDVETRIRNAALESIHRLGYGHILIVDGDELWRPGALSQIHNLVSEGCQCVSMLSTPVLGLPGYPVEREAEGENDIIVYVGRDTMFDCCRSPNTPYYRLMDRPWVYHFTGTRRTLAEIEDKMRESGHYDDPNYDFEGWIKNTLPNVKPGMKNAHMYLPRQAWPGVREWRADELAEIPSDLHQYLGIPKLRNPGDGQA